MKKTTIRVIFILLLISLFPQSQTNATSSTIGQAKEGVLDLHSTSLTNQIVPLNGFWEFEWKTLSTPADWDNPKKYLQVPSAWSKAAYSGDTTLSNLGYGTYHLQILLHEDDIGKLLSLYLPSVASAYKLWVNDELIAENGVVGTDKKTSKPKSYSKVVNFVPKTDEVQLTMQVANFSQRKGGMWSSIRLGTDATIRHARETNLIRDILIASTLFALGIYLISLYLFNKSILLPLFLGSFCLFVAVRTLVVGDMLLIYLFPSFPWELAVKIEYLTFYIGFLMVFMYLYLLFPKEMNRKIVYVAVTICTLFSLTTVLPASIFTHLLVAFEVCIGGMAAVWLYTVTVALFRKREGALLNLISILMLLASVFHDILYYNQTLISFDLVPIAAAFFLFAQTLIVAKKSSHAFDQVEKLSKEILRANEILEQKVIERTQVLQEKNKQLEHIEQTRKSFFSSVAHELGTPMQAIQGYIQLILSMSHQPSEQWKYLHIVQDKTLLINRLIKDLLDLAKMEESQFDFVFEKTNVTFLLEHLYNRFKHDIEQAGIKSQFISIESLPSGYIPIGNIDIVRFEQVISNLIDNAVKHTPKGGVIMMKGDIRIPDSIEGEATLLIHISDTGVGISQELLPVVFERFRKGKRSLQKKEGSGLGLAISQEIVKKHGGIISATSELGVGSIFTIKLPIHIEKEED